jgi:hypothetical protein
MSELPCNQVIVSSTPEGRFLWSRVLAAARVPDATQA